jgi:NADP-dependent 3-hydroxy acid dehydrogenase YdfG
MPHSPLERGKVEDWDRMIDVNLKGVLYGIAAALPYMKQQKSGHVINVSSVAGHKVNPGGAVDAATKHGVRIICRAPLRPSCPTASLNLTSPSASARSTQWRSRPTLSRVWLPSP